MTPKYCPKCGTPLSGMVCPRCVLAIGLEPPTTPSTGRFVAPTVEELAPKLPDLEILELIGQGGMGAVYKARQKALDRIVAVKVLPAGPTLDAAFAERFTREARALAKLCHPNIVAVYDFGRAGELCYFVMEYVEGANLRQMMAAGTLTPADALRIVPQVCEALQFAHDEGVVHRDIKPENILVDKRGRVKIADFGLAKLMIHAPVDVTLTMENHVLGTPRYMAPEQIERPATVDHRADIYSLGVVLYEMLTGELPMGRFAPPSQKAPMDARLDEVVLRTLEKDPQRRYQRADEVGGRLSTIGGRPLAPAPRRDDAQPDRTYRPAPPGKQWWFARSAEDRVWTKLFYAAVAVIGLVLGLSLEMRTEIKDDKAITTTEIGMPDAWYRHASDSSKGWFSSLRVFRWSFAFGVAGAMSAWYLYKIDRVERRRDAHERRLRATLDAEARHQTLKPGSGPMLAMIGASVAVCGLMMTAGIALAVLAFQREQVGSNAFWGWMGGAFGCVIGGAGGIAGSWNSYRQVTGRTDFMSVPRTTPFDRALVWYTVLGVLVLMATAATWRLGKEQPASEALVFPPGTPNFPEPGSYADVNWAGRWEPAIILRRERDTYTVRQVDGFQHEATRAELRPLSPNTFRARDLLGMGPVRRPFFGYDSRLFGLILGGLMTVQGSGFLAVRSVMRKTYAGGPSL